MATACRRRSGLRSSPADLLQHVDVERLVGHELLQPAVLALELTQSLGIVGAQLAVALTLAVIGLLGDLQVLEHRGEILALADELVGLVELSHHLFGRVTSALHESPPAPRGGRDSHIRWTGSRGADHDHEVDRFSRMNIQRAGARNSLMPHSKATRRMSPTEET